jgi:transcription elongation GreA/GreB family factor
MGGGRLREELVVEFPERLREAFAFGDASAVTTTCRSRKRRPSSPPARKLEEVLATAKVLESETREGRVMVGSTVQLAHGPSPARPRGRRRDHRRAPLGPIGRPQG